MRDGEPLTQVVAEFRARPVTEAPAHVGDAPGTFTVTIADLGTFNAATYPDDLQRWARAALAAPSTGAI